MADPREQAQLLELIQDPTLSENARLEALQMLEPALREVSPQARVEALKALQPPPPPAPEPSFTQQMGKAFFDPIGTVGEVAHDAGEVLSLPGKYAVKGLQAMGVNTETPRPPLFSVPLTIPPVDVHPLGEQVEELTSLAMPWAGLKGATSLARTGAEKLFGREKAIPPINPLFNVPPEATVPQIDPILKEAFEGGGLSNRPIIPAGPKKPTDISITEITTDPWDTFNRIGKEAPIIDMSSRDLHKAATNPIDEVMNDGLRGAVLGINGPVSLPKAQAVDKAIKDTNKLTPPAKDLDEAMAVPGAANPKKLEVLPGALTRFFTPALDVIKSTGPKGEALSDILWSYLDTVERETSHRVVNVDAEFSRILGAKTAIEQKVARRFNPFKDYEMEQLYNNFTTEDKKQLVDYLYTHGTMQPTGEKADMIRELGKVFYEKGTKETSELVGKAGFTVPDPMMPGGRLPYGSPDMFYPHKPIRDKIVALKDLRLKQLYEAAKAQGKFNGSLDDYRKRIEAFAMLRNGQVDAGMFGWVGKARGFDAAELGRPSEVLEALGYDTDPVRVLFAFNSNGLRSGYGKMIEGTANLLADDIRADIRKSTLNKNKGEYVTKLLERTLGKPPLEQIDLQVNDFLHDIRHFNDVTLLQMAALPQFNQLTYIVGRGGFQNTLEAAIRAAKGEMTGLPERSGAMFTSLLNEFTPPSRIMGRLATGTLRGSGFTMADAELRQFGGVVGGHIAEKMSKVLIAHPQNPKALNFFRELKVDPQEIIKTGQLTPEMREVASQNFANMTSGRTDVRTLPLWLTKQEPYAQLFYQYKKFLFNNVAELRRQVFDAEVPTATRVGRGARILATAGALGELSRELQLAVSHLDNPFDIEGEKRVAPPLRVLYKESPAAAYTIDRILYGMGSVFGLIAFAAMETAAESLYESVFGPTPGLVADVVTGVNKGIKGSLAGQDKAWKPLTRDMSRRIPAIGPFGPPLVDEAFRVPFEGSPIKPFSPIRPMEPEE